MFEELHLLDSPASGQRLTMWSSSFLLIFTGATFNRSTDNLVQQDLHLWYSRPELFGLDICKLDSNLKIEDWNQSSGCQSGQLPIEVDPRHVPPATATQHCR